MVKIYIHGIDISNNGGKIDKNKKKRIELIENVRIIVLK